MKKKQTDDERHAPTFVPKEEQPYEVPANWRWVRLRDVLTTSKEKSEDFSNSTTKYVGLEHMEKDGGAITFGNAEELKSVKNVFHPGQILYGKLRPYLNKHGIAAFDGICSTDILVFNAMNNVHCKFVNNYLSLPTFIEYAAEQSKGINLPRVSENVVLAAPFPLPPFTEQQRIVDRVERLFAALDAAREKAQAVLAGCETRKAAILHKAFTGELTTGWRTRNSKNIYTWESKMLSECCVIGSGGTPSRKNPAYYEGNIPWIKTSEINWNDIFDSEEKITADAIENSSAKLYKTESVLVAMYGMGATRGRAAILKVEAATNQAVCVLQPKDYLKNRFLFYYFMYNYWSFREQSIGGNQLNLSGTIIGGFRIKIPSPQEQVEIINILDGLLQKERQVQTAAQAVLSQIDALKRSILARAFRGELGTNDPAEPPASL